MSGMMQKFIGSNAPRSAILIRLAVGAVFLTEGILKFLYPGELGSGRFERIGIPSPHAMASIVGVVEILAGAAILIGLLTRAAALALLIDISVAIASTKLPILLGHAIWKFKGITPALGHTGFLSMMHEARTDLAMLLGLLFLLIVGAGRWSFDARLGGGGGGGKPSQR